MWGERVFGDNCRLYVQRKISGRLPPTDHLFTTLGMGLGPHPRRRYGRAYHFYHFFYPVTHRDLPSTFLLLIPLSPSSAPLSSIELLPPQVVKRAEALERLDDGGLPKVVRKW